MKNEKYWDSRANKSVKYKNEFFYTITPLPYYYKRREVLRASMEKYIEKHNNILDFGCGDGKYIKFFSKKNHKNFTGIDLSKKMIEIATLENTHSKFYVSSTGLSTIEWHGTLVYSIAVFAHILDDDVVQKIFKDIYMKLPKGGEFIIFEATTSKNRREGTTYIRRLAVDYLELAKRAGFNVEEKKLLYFKSHRFFENKIAGYFYKVYALFYKNPHIIANKSIFFRLLSSLFLIFDRNPIYPFDKYEGNTFYVFRK